METEGGRHRRMPPVTWGWIGRHMTRNGGIVWIFLAFLVAAVGGPLASPAAAASAKSPVAKAARLSGDAKHVRFVAELSFAVSYNVYVLPDPFRVIIDLPQVNFQIPPAEGVEHAGFIEGFRYGLVDAGKSRIVLDANAPVLIQKSFVMRARGDQPARIVVDLVVTDAKGFAQVHHADETRLAAAMEEMPPISAKAAEAKDANNNPITGLLAKPSVPLPRPKPALDIASTNKAKDAASLPPARHVIVIDPGHGGIDSGTVAHNGVKEKDVVLAFARELKRQLEADKRFRVVMTRNDDYFITLRNRVKVARDAKAELLIALHADSVSSSRVRGATVYTLSERASDREADLLAQKENRADIIAGVNLAAETDDVTGILIDLAQRETKNHSVFFAKSLVGDLQGKILLHSRPLRAAGFRVLKAPDVPSILVELGYLSNRRDEKLLVQQSWRKKTAAAMVEALNGYFSTQIASGR